MWIHDPRFEEPNLLVPGKKPVGPVSVVQPRTFTIANWFLLQNPKQDPSETPTKYTDTCIVSGAGADFVGDATSGLKWDIVADEVGRALYTESHANRPAFINANSIFASQDQGFFFDFRHTNASGASWITPYSSPVMRFRLYQNIGIIEFRENVLGIQYSSPVVAPTQPARYRIAIYYSSSSGRVVLSANGRAFEAFASSGLTWDIRLFFSEWTQAINGKLYSFGRITGQPSLPELCSFTRNPYQLLIPA